MDKVTSNSYMQMFIGEQIHKKMLDEVEENSKIKEDTLGWRFFNHILKEDEIKAEAWRLLNQDIGPLKMSYKENLMKEEMSRDKNIAKTEYKLQYKQVKDFSVKDLEEAGACETALLKILKDKQCLYEIPFRYGYWSDDREQYFNQDFNGVNGLVWLENHGFIQKLEPEYIYAKDLKYGEYAILHEGYLKGNLVFKPYGVDKLVSVVDPLATWSDPYVKVRRIDKSKVEVSYRFKD